MPSDGIRSPEQHRGALTNLNPLHFRVFTPTLPSPKCTCSCLVSNTLYVHLGEVPKAEGVGSGYRVGRFLPLSPWERGRGEGNRAVLKAIP